MSKSKAITVIKPGTGTARVSKGTEANIAASDKTADMSDAARKELAKKRRADKRAAYPVIILKLKLNSGAQSRDVLDRMLETTLGWAGTHKYVVSQTEPTVQKSGATALEVTIDTPESFASKTRVKGDSGKTREISKAVATALRSDAVLAKAAEMGVEPKDLVINALQSQFGITIEL